MWTLLLIGIFSFANQDFYKSLRQDASNENENEVRALKTELLVQASEQKALAQIRKLINMYRKSPMEPGLQLRKAELYMRMSKTERFFEINRDSSTIVKLVPQQAKKASERKYISRAINTYDYIEASYPRFRDMDLVLFNSGFARQQVGQDKAARKKYQKLIDHFQESPLIPEAYLALGEMEFEKHKFQLAANYFEKIKKYPDSKIYPYGRYKLAWSYFNLKRNDDAMAELESVVNYGKNNKYARSNKRLDLRKEALNDMVLFYADFKPAKKALSYFSEFAGKEEAPNYLLKLAKLYDRHGKKQEQLIVLEDIINKRPNSYYIAKAYKDILKVYDSEKQYAQVVSSLESFAKVCNRDSKWQKNFEQLSFENIDYEPKQLSCASNFDAYVVPLAQNWDKQLRKKYNKVLFESVVRVYEIYLSDSAGKKNDVPMHYAFSELLFHRKDYARASKEYFLTAQKAKNPQTVHDASYSSIVSLEKSVKGKWEEKQEERYVVLATFYIANNPKGKHIEAVEFKRAFIVYDNGRFDEAAPMLKVLGEKYAYKPQGMKAQDLYLDILNAKKDYAKIKEYTQALLEKKYSKERKKTIRDLYQQSYFLSVQLMENQSPKDAFVEYQKFAKQNKGSPLAPKAWWNSLTLLQKLDLKTELAKSSFEYTSLFPKADKQKQALILSVQSYEAVANFEGAIQALNRLVSVDKAKRNKWLELKADYNYLMGNYDSAIKSYVSLAKSVEVKERAKIHSKLADIYHEKGNKKQREHYLDQITRTSVQPFASDAMLYFVEKYYQAENYPLAFKTAAKVLQMPKTANSSAKAKARWIQANILGDEFYRQSVKSSQPERIPLVLAIKTEKLDKAQRAFEAAIRYDDPIVSAKSVAAMAGLYGHYAKAIRSVKLPEEVPQADAQAFYQEMENLAIPMEEKEVETLVQAKKLIQKVGLFDGTNIEVQKRLDQLNSKPEVETNVQLKQPEVLLPSVSGGVG
tara:strand:+ start:10847 stop:13774 length:2928 start_codon:yes stop_codon:yes gene_type:complete